MAAFDDAIADGVDIITVSLGSSGAHAFEVDPIAIGSFHAMAKGILTLNSAGNSGPSLQTASSLAPWLMTVAASSIDRRIISKVSLANGTTIIVCLITHLLRCIISFHFLGASFKFQHFLHVWLRFSYDCKNREVQ